MKAAEVLSLLGVQVVKRSDGVWQAEAGMFYAEGGLGLDGREAALRILGERIAGLRGIRRYLFAGDGTVLCCYHSPGSWGYDIAEKGRKRACWSTGWPTLEAVIAAARAHAEQSYGGIVGECG